MHTFILSNLFLTTYIDRHVRTESYRISKWECQNLFRQNEEIGAFFCNNNNSEMMRCFIVKSPFTVIKICIHHNMESYGKE